MFITKIYKTIWAEDPPERGSFSDNVGFYPEHLRVGYALKLPFCPCLGLRISDHTEKENFESGEIINITWNHHEKAFNCLVEDEAPFIFEGQSYEFDWLIDEAIKDGWKKLK
jgi:hypothetical protein